MSLALWLMLNPSTAGADVNDATVRNIVQRTVRWAGATSTPETRGSARFSPCGRYRYELRRTWSGLQLDAAAVPVRSGITALAVGNLYSRIATDPRELNSLTLAERIGPDGEGSLIDLIKEAELIICAWGNGSFDSVNWPAHQARAQSVLETIRYAGKVPMMLRATAAGMPRHPLRFPAFVPPIPVPIA